MPKPRGQALTYLDLTQWPKPRTVWDISGTGSVRLYTGIGLIRFISWRNTSPSNNVYFRLRDGTGPTGPVLMVMGAAAGTGDNATPGDPGIPFGIGLYLDVITGSPHITVTFIPLLEQLP